MRIFPTFLLIITLHPILVCVSTAHGQSSLSQEAYRIPHLAKKGNTTQLIVHGKPFIIRGGELGNSSFTSLEYMAPVWAKLRALNLNTVLAPVYWELIEPAEGEFDFRLYDQLIDEARNHDLKLILLWFASWKNSMSSHAPAWVKTNQEKYPRVKDENGISQEILTPFSGNNLQADMNAFKALMTHIKVIDLSQHTVIMIQPENEIGMLASARDHSVLANERFNAEVPQDLVNYLLKNKEKLVPEFQAVLGENWHKTGGTWEEVFGEGKINGILLDKQKQDTKLTFGKYGFTVKHSHTLGWEGEARDEYWIPGGAIIIQTSVNEFYLAGSGIVITFNYLSNPDGRVGILKAEEGRFRNNQWEVIRHLNGDQTHQGRHIRIFRSNVSVQRFELYEYD